MESDMIVEHGNYPGQFKVHERDALADRINRPDLLGRLSELSTDPIWKERYEEE
jgi:hypothetical protein